jgi:hypothetical protein
MAKKIMVINPPPARGGEFFWIAVPGQGKEQKNSRKAW